MKKKTETVDYTNMNHHQYLLTPKWQSIRESVIKRDSGKCLFCGGGGTEVHHKTYAHLGNETEHLEDLALLCRDCHADIHRRNPLCENSLEITFDGLKYLNVFRANKGAILYGFNTLWDEEYILKEVRKTINRRLKSIAGY